MVAITASRPRAARVDAGLAPLRGEGALAGFTDDERETFAALLARFVAAWPSSSGV